MEDGRSRARPSGPESVDDLLARHGLAGAPPGGRAARRRAAEQAEAEAERSPVGSEPERPAGGRRRAPEPPAPPVEPTRHTRDDGGPRHGDAPGDRPRNGVPVRNGRAAHGAEPRPGGAGVAPRQPARRATGRDDAPRNGARPGPPAADGTATQQVGTPRPPGTGRSVAGAGAPPPARPAARTASAHPASARTASVHAASARPASAHAASVHAASTRAAEPPPGARPAPVDAATTAVRSAPARRTGLDDIGSGAQDVSEQAERSRRAGSPGRRRGSDRTESQRIESQRIDETLTRLDAAHTGPAVEEPAAPRRRLPRPTAGRVLVLALAAVVFVTTAVGFASHGWLSSGVRTVAALDEGSGAIVDAETQAGDENVLVVATDLGAAPATPQGTPAPQPDTVLVAHVPSGGGPMTVLSVPTDLEINRPPCERFDRAGAGYTGEVVPAEARTQLATALDAGGPRCATRVIQQLTGLAITKYVGMDLDRMGALVDAAGGVQVCVPQPVLDAVLGPVLPDPGTQSLDGSRAADFVRAADVEGDPPADQGRIERQQQVLAGVLGGALSTGGLLDLPRVAELRPALGTALVTDGAGLDEVLALSSSLRGMTGDGIVFTTVPTTSEANGRGNAVLRDADAAALFGALREHTELPASATDTAEGASGPRPADLTVELINASGRTGLAAEIGTTLTGLGFGVGAMSNATQPTPQTVIRYSPDQAAAADLLGGSIPAATAVPDPGSTGVLQLVIGAGFDKVVKPPVTTAAATTSVGSATASC